MVLRENCSKFLLSFCLLSPQNNYILSLATTVFTVISLYSWEYTYPGHVLTWVVLDEFLPVPMRTHLKHSKNETLAEQFLTV